MRDYCNDYCLKVKDDFKKVQNIINGIILGCAIGSFAYFIFWVGATNDPYILKSGANFFGPLAQYLNPFSSGVEIYLSTSFMLAFAVIPMLFIHYLFDKNKEAKIAAYTKKEAKRQQKEMIEEQKTYESRYDCIKRYSICLSIDYEGENKVSPQNKAKLNNAIYSKIKNKLNIVDEQAFISLSDVLIFSSNNFSKYDSAYDSILNTLSSVKSGIEQAYKVKIIPSMTTDAYSERVVVNNIRNQHFEIQSFNFKNRALSTATFAKKYKHLKHNKYAGIPIGEYAYFKDNKTDTYELNVVHKNLVRTLSQAV